MMTHEEFLAFHRELDFFRLKRDRRLLRSSAFRGNPSSPPPPPFRGEEEHHSWLDDPRTRETTPSRPIGDDPDRNGGAASAQSKVIPPAAIDQPAAVNSPDEPANNGSPGQFMVAASTTGAEAPPVVLKRPEEQGMLATTDDPDSHARKTAVRRANWEWFQKNVRWLTQEHSNQWVVVSSPDNARYFKTADEAHQTVEKESLEWEAVVWFLQGHVRV